MLEPAAAHDVTVGGDLRHVCRREWLGGADCDGAGLRAAAKLEGETVWTVVLESIESRLFVRRVHKRAACCGERCQFLGGIVSHALVGEDRLLNLSRHFTKCFASHYR